MNKINPLYLLLLFTVITFVSFFTLELKKNEVKKSFASLSSFSKTANEYALIKNVWLNKNKIKRDINALLRSLTSEQITKMELLDSIKIKMESKNEKKLSAFLNKLLNANFLFLKLEITQNVVFAEIRLN